MTVFRTPLSEAQLLLLRRADVGPVPWENMVVLSGRDDRLTAKELEQMELVVLDRKHGVLIAESGRAALRSGDWTHGDAAENTKGSPIVSLCKTVLPRFLELKRYRQDREGKAHAQDFDEVENLLRETIAKSEQPRDFHVVRPGLAEWAKSEQGDPPMVAIELLTETESWVVGMTGSDAAVLCAKLGEALRSTPEGAT